MGDIPQTRYVRTPDGIDLAYRIFEGGPADLVYVDAFVNAMEIWLEWPGTRQLFDGLTSFSRLVQFDGRGSGLSGRTGAPPTLESRVGDIGVIMDVAKLEHAAILAFSDGAAVAALFAATYPERVSALILFHPLVRTTWAEDYPWGARPEDVRAARGEYLELWNTVEPSADQITLISGEVGPYADDPGFRTWFTRALRHCMTPAEFEAYEEAWLETDARPVLPAIQAPTVILYRSADEADHEWAEAISAAIPGATRKELPGPPYFIPMIGDVEALVDAVAAHLRVERPAAEHDRVLATVLFTDIVGSTERAAELGDRAWRDLLGRHHEVVRAQLDRFRGVEVDTAGDGFLARFDGPARGVRCAQAITEAVRPLGLEIRAGVHTGEVEAVGDKLEGIAIHTGARVCSCAGASEVLVSSTVKDLVAGSGLAFEDAGEHELKGVPGRWRLYRVVS